MKKVVWLEKGTLKKMGDSQIIGEEVPKILKVEV